jgi:hypothetical protein
MLFATSDPRKMADKIVGKLSKELTLGAAPPYEIDTDGQARPNSIGQALGDLSTALFGGRTRPLHTVRGDVRAAVLVRRVAVPVAAGARR